MSICALSIIPRLRCALPEESLDLRENGAGSPTFREWLRGIPLCSERPVFPASRPALRWLLPCASLGSPESADHPHPAPAAQCNRRALRRCTWEFDRMSPAQSRRDRCAGAVRRAPYQLRASSCELRTITGLVAHSPKHVGSVYILYRPRSSSLRSSSILRRSSGVRRS